MFIQMVNIQAALLLYLLYGVLCRRLRIITPDNQQNFIDLLLTILMPCMVFNSFRSITLEMLRNTLSVLAVSLSVCLLSWLLGKVLYRRAAAERRDVLRYATLINNAGFAGLPLAQEMFGEEGLIYASVFLIPIRIFMWSAGITMLSRQRSGWKSVAVKLLKNPCILAVLAGLARGLLQVSLPPFVETALSRLGDCVSPLSMVLIGSIIAGVEPRGLLDKWVVGYTGLRLIVLPLCVLALGRLLGLPTAVTGTAVTLTAMPAATTTALLAARYGADAAFASRLVLVSTVLSLVTAPFLLLLL